MSSKYRRAKQARESERDHTDQDLTMYPYGKISSDDEGELTMALATDRASGVIRIVFAAPTTWIGLPSRLARDLAKMLIEKADELDRSKM